MSNTFRHRVEEQEGFTLIELLVVILIIGILAAIAIPSFINQKDKANDGAAKALAHSAQTIMEAYSVDHNGGYTGVNAPSDLVSLEPGLNGTSNTSEAYISTATGSGFNYTIVVTSPASGDAFSVVKSGNTVTRSCSGGRGGCIGGSW